MKRCWFGFFLLVGLLSLSVISTVMMTRVHETVEQDLLRAAEEAVTGDWIRAEQSFSQARQTWERWEKLRACLADHTPVEEVDSAFAAAEVYRGARESLVFAAACRQLARQTAAVGEAHEMVWWNIL